MCSPIRRGCLFLVIIAINAIGMDSGPSSYASLVQSNASTYVLAPRFMESADQIKKQLAHKAMAETFLRMQSTCSSDIDTSAPETVNLPSYRHYASSITNHELTSRQPSFVSFNIDLNNSRISKQESKLPLTYEQLTQKQNFIAKNCWVPIRKPDVSKDTELQIIRKKCEEGDIGEMYRYLHQETGRLDECFTDRAFERSKLYLISRRLSLILKYLDHPVFRSLLAMHQSHHVEDVEAASQFLQFEALNVSEIAVNGEKPIPLDTNKKAAFLKIAYNILDQREDYQRYKNRRMPPSIQRPIIAQSRAAHSYETVVEEPLTGQDKIEESYSPHNITSFLTKSAQVVAEASSTSYSCPSDITYLEHSVSALYEAVQELQLKTLTDPNAYVPATMTFIADMQKQGLLQALPDTQYEILQAGLTSFFYNLRPENPLNDPKAFICEVSSIAIWSALHTLAPGWYLSGLEAAMIAEQVYEICSPHQSLSLTSKQRAELFGKTTAELVKGYISSKVLTGAARVVQRKMGPTLNNVVNKVSKKEQVFSPASAEAVTPEGTKFKVEPFEEGMHLQENINNPKISSSTSSASLRKIEKIANIKELFQKNEFGKIIEKGSIKTKKVDVKTNSQIYELIEKLSEYNLKKGDLFYLDKFHGDHIEVFRNDKCIGVFNLDGTINEIKTAKAIGRDLMYK
jgi:hypothetical protein